MTAIQEKDVLEALSQIVEHDSQKDVVSMGMISGVSIKDGHVSFIIQVPPGTADALEPLRLMAEDAVKTIPGVSGASAVLYAERAASGCGGGHGHAHAGGAAAAAPAEALLPDVRAIIAVSSAKGGVGKSTTAANLAVALKEKGLKVGLFDADIYGPSLPRMMGVSAAQPHSPDGKSITPIEAHGMKMMSMGFMVGEEEAIVWRGPMVMGALEQMLRDVSWGELDVLVVDMPPGTGDTQLTMTQKVPLSGAVIVSTPQDIALLDARKGMTMFRSINVPVLGMIENMSYYRCPQCGHEEHIFGHGGAREDAKRLGLDFLGELPLDINIRTTSDEGSPIVIAQPDSPLSAIYRDIADKIWTKLEPTLSAPKGPKITMK